MNEDERSTNGRMNRHEFSFAGYTADRVFISKPKKRAKQKNAEPGVLFSRLETAMMRLWIWYVLSWMLIRLQAVVLGPVVLLMFWRWSQITIITTTSTVTIATKSLMPPEWKQIIPSLFVVVFILSVFFSFVRKTSFPYVVFSYNFCMDFKTSNQVINELRLYQTIRNRQLYIVLNSCLYDGGRCGLSGCPHR